MKLELLFQIRRSTLTTLQLLNEEILKLNPPWEEVVFQGEPVLAIQLCKKQLRISFYEAKKMVDAKYEECQNGKALHS